MRQQRQTEGRTDAGPASAPEASSPGNSLRAEAASAGPTQDPASSLAAVDGGIAPSGPPSGSGGAGDPPRVGLAPGVEAAMTADVEAIVSALQRQVLTSNGEEEIVARVRAWRDADIADTANPAGHAHMDRFLLKLRMRSFTRNTAATGFIEYTMNAYDTLWRELEDDRLTAFQQLIEGSRHASTGPDSEGPENLFGTLARHEAMGVLGMVGGLSSGVAGIADAASSAITSVGNLIGDATGLGHMDAPLNYSSWIEQQYDFMGEAAFGREWNEDTGMGVSSGHIGMGGGRVLAALTMLGAGGAMGAPGAAGSAILPAGEAALFATRALATLGIVGSIGGVVTSATAIAADLQRLQTARGAQLTTADVLSDAEFLTHVAALSSSVFGAVSGGMGMRTPGGAGAQPPNPLTVATIGAFIESAGAVAELARIAEAMGSNQTEAQKQAIIRASLESFISRLVNAAGGLAGVRDAHQAEARATPSTEPVAPVGAGGERTPVTPALPEPHAAIVEAAELHPVAAVEVAEPHATVVEATPEAPVARATEPERIVVDDADIMPLDEPHAATDDAPIVVDDADIMPIEEPVAPSEVTLVDPEVGDAAATPQRAPVGPVSPEAGGFPPESSALLQLAADVLGVIIKARPSNPDSLPHLLAQTAVPKMELIKAKTINQLDVLLGANPENVGLVGLFEPHPPPDGLAPDVHARAMDRFRQRTEEFHHLSAEYDALVEQGVLRIDDGVLQIADPRMPGADGEPHGQFRPIAGDIDIFDITHRDGSPLSAAERTAVQAYLRSAGIGVEHGAHAWWQDQNPASFDPAMDARIRGQHNTEQQLISFLPGGTSAVGVWADSPITATAPSGSRSPMDLDRVTVTEAGGQSAGEPTRSPNDFIDLGDLIETD